MSGVQQYVVSAVTAAALSFDLLGGSGDTLRVLGSDTAENMTFSATEVLIGAAANASQ